LDEATQRERPVDFWGPESLGDRQQIDQSSGRPVGSREAGEKVKELGIVWLARGRGNAGRERPDKGPFEMVPVVHRTGFANLLTQRPHEVPTGVCEVAAAESR
jgi:hypothetical protein